MLLNTKSVNKGDPDLVFHRIAKALNSITSSPVNGSSKGKLNGPSSPSDKDHQKGCTSPELLVSSWKSKASGGKSCGETGVRGGGQTVEGVWICFADKSRMRPERSAIFP